MLVHDDIIIGFNNKTRTIAGLGADDKNGIWIALQCFLKFPVIKLAFFVEEEVGCHGSHACDMSFFDDARFVIQCDRKGNTDFVATACGVKLCTDEFLADAKIKDFGYTACYTGGLTDVKTLRDRKLKVCSCNISCGYYDPHTDHETTDFRDLENCLALVEHMVEHMVKVYEFPIPVTTYPTYTNYGTYQNKKSKATGTFYGGGYSSDYEENLFTDDYYVGDTHVHIKRNKKQKVDAKSYQEQLHLAEMGLKDALLNNVAYSPYEFFMENKNVIPNVSYATITQIFTRLKNELFKSSN